VSVAGLLLTGGASRRYGSPKAELALHGERLADRGARVLRAVCDDVIEVGPGYSSLPAVREAPAGSGPLAALAAGIDAIRTHSAPASILVLAVDLPFVDVALLEYLRDYESPNAVVPRVGGIAQPLSARYGNDVAEVARALLADGARSMRALLDVLPVTWLDENDWGVVAAGTAFVDVDTPDDAVRSGLESPG
jgi:molybdopterin-guanine dinucleotide biosynthesis protein A